MRVLVTSRRETDIEDEFNNRNTPTIQIEAASVHSDIQLYVRHMVDDLVRRRKLKVSSRPLKEKIKTTLMENAQGMFLWVNLQLRNLCEQRSDQDIERELYQLPQGLFKTYERILGQIQSKPPVLRNLARTALTSICFAGRPLHVHELKDAAAITEDCRCRDDMNAYSAEAIFECCANLVVEEGGVVRLVHYSVKEYFINTPPLELPLTLRGVGNTETSHAFLARNCLIYLQLEDFKQGPSTSEGTIRRRCNNNPFAWYAAEYFDYHLDHLERHTEELEKELSRLLTDNDSNLAAILQIRRMGDGNDWNRARNNFSVSPSKVSAATLIFATRLQYFLANQGATSLWSKLEQPADVFHLAAASGSIDAVRNLIGKGVQVNEPDELGATALYYAATGGHRELCSLLLRHNCDVNAQGGAYGTPLQGAAQGGYFEIAKLLIDNGADVN
ncbi:hypothetical protein BU26DRAFT_431073, partial [Trematosphaeria pertusa]